MKAHKVPATYYASWKIPGKNHSFYVFYKDKLYITKETSLLILK